MLDDRHLDPIQFLLLSSKSFTCCLFLKFFSLMQQNPTSFTSHIEGRCIHAIPLHFTKEDISPWIPYDAASCSIASVPNVRKCLNLHSATAFCANELKSSQIAERPEDGACASNKAQQFLRVSQTCSKGDFYLKQYDAILPALHAALHKRSIRSKTEASISSITYHFTYVFRHTS